jgi:RimJ/RimL family protein N-acetyltransferase
MAWTSSAASCWDNGTDYRFVVVDACSDDILGGVGINQVVAQHQAGNLGYWVRTSALNRGVCTTAARLACEFAFQHLKFVRLDVHVHPDNMASNSVAVKLGGVFEGTQRNRIMMHGEPCAANCYSIIPSDLGINCCGAP